MKMNRIHVCLLKFKNKNTWIMIVLLGITFLLHEIWNLFIKNPWVMGDEVAVMATGAYFAGYDWKSVLQYAGEEGVAYFHNGGLGILFTPLFMLIKNRPYFLYQAIISLCSLFHSIPVMISYSIMHKNFKIQNKVFCALISISASFFVSWHSTNAINESGLILCTWIIIYMIVILADSISVAKRRFINILLAFVLGYTYTVHTRALIFVLSVIFIAILYQIFYQKSLIIFKIFVPCIGIAFYLAAKFNSFVLDNVFLSGNDVFIYNTGQSTSISVLMGLKELFTEAKWQGFFDIFVSNLLGTGVISLGLFFIVFFILIKVSIKEIGQRGIRKQCILNEDSHKYLLIGWIIYICYFGITLLYSIHTLENAVVAIDGGECTRSLFYLRYPGAFIGPLIMLAGVNIYKFEEIRDWKIIGASVVGMVGCLIYTSISIVSRIVDKGDSQFDFSHYFSPFYFGKYGQEVLSIHFYISMGVISVILLTLLVLIRYKKNVIISILLMGFMVYQYSYNAYNFDKNNAEYISNYAYRVAELFYDNENLSNEISILYWPMKECWEAPYLAQFLVPEVEVKKEIPEEKSNFTVVLSYKADKSIFGKNCYWAQLDEYTYIYAKGKDKYALERAGVQFTLLE